MEGRVCFRPIADVHDRMQFRDMTGDLRLLLTATVFVVVPTAMVYGLPLAVFSALTVVAVALVVGAYRGVTREERSPQQGSKFIGLLLCGSVVVGALYLLVISNIRPQPGPLNLIWMLGLPTAVGLLLQPRLRGLTLSLPLGITGWVWMFIAAMTFKIPL